MHDSFTVNYASAFQTRELQYGYAAYQQVLTAEGLTAFVDASYGWGHPGRPIDPLFHYKTLSAVAEAGLTYPFIRQRERNLSATALFFASDDQGVFFEDPLTPPSSRNKLRGVRLKVNADLADEAGGINAFNVGSQPRLRGAGKLAKRQRPADAGQRPGRFHQARGDRDPATAAYPQLLVPGRRSTPNMPSRSLLSSELCGYGGRVFGRAYDPSDLVGDSCLLLLGELRADMPIGAKEITQAQLYAFADRGRLYNHNVAPNSGTLASVDGASVGGGFRFGWQSNYMADLSVAKAVAGPRDDARFFLILTGRY